MQQGYVYQRYENEDKSFNNLFKPELTSADMLSLGAFEGKHLTDCQK